MKQKKLANLTSLLCCVCKHFSFNNFNLINLWTIECKANVLHSQSQSSPSFTLPVPSHFHPWGPLLLFSFYSSPSSLLFPSFTVYLVSCAFKQNMIHFLLNHNHIQIQSHFRTQLINKCYRSSVEKNYSQFTERKLRVFPFTWFFNCIKKFNSSQGLSQS